MDYNGDGFLDLVGGQFGGYVYIVLGKEKGQYQAPVKLKDKKGRDVHLGEYWDKAKKGWAENKKRPFRDLGLYPLAVDWDGDGDLDLLTGGYGGKLGVRLNEGTRKRPQYATTTTPVKAGKSNLKVEGGLSPAFVDWNGDGLKDLICASSSGTIRYYENVGKKTAPRFKEGVVLLKRPGLRYLKVTVGDLNQDGKLDLIYGASGNEKPNPVWVMYRK